jgi:hypothetical protein
MARPLLKYLAGIFSGFVLSLVALMVLSVGKNSVLGSGLSSEQGSEMFRSASLWLELNLGHSIWLFLAVLTFYTTNLIQLRKLISRHSPFSEVVKLDQLSDVWIHLFIGIGVIWTAIGMRSALATTLSSPDSLADGAGQILTRLVDGGILLALTTTIIGAIGGYLMQLTKTILLSAELTTYYHQQDQAEIHTALSRLALIESHLSRMAKPEREPQLHKRTRQWVVQ